VSPEYLPLGIARKYTRINFMASAKVGLPTYGIFHPGKFDHEKITLSRHTHPAFRVARHGPNAYSFSK
jgi:hypothetical protein